MILLKNCKLILHSSQRMVTSLVTSIGDANNVGTIKDAIHAGYDIAKEL